MKFRRRLRLAGALLLALAILGAFVVWQIGGALVAPANHPIGGAPADLRVFWGVGRIGFDAQGSQVAVDWDDS